LLLRLVLLVLFLTPPIDTQRSGSRTAIDYNEDSSNRSRLEKRSSRDDVVVELKAHFESGEKGKPKSDTKANLTNLTYYELTDRMNRYKRAIELMKEEKSMTE
ncbi:hypothetical protein PMAYCL1PPCAC_01700, partial [Pristionchus mayeri]